MLYEKERKKLCIFMKVMFDRFLTNAAGGNVSIKVSDTHKIMTPTLMSQNYLCNLSPYQILVVDQNDNIIEGDGKITREMNMHEVCYQENPQIKCVIHAHAKEALFFATQEIDMPNLTEATQKFGEIKCLAFAPATTTALAETVREEVKHNQQLPKALLLSKHGVLVMDSSLEKAYDMLERLEYNANIAYKSMVFDALSIKKMEHKDYHYNVEE